MTPEKIAELEQLNEKRTPGEWRLGRIGFDNGGQPVTVLLVTTDKGDDVPCVCLEFKHNPAMRQSNAKFIAALANACDAGLLDAARKGMEADYGTAMTIDSLTAQLAAVKDERDRAKRDIDCLLETQSGMVRNREELLSQLAAVKAENVGLDRQLVTCGQLLRSARDRVSELLDRLAAVTAERDELQEDLAYWMNAPDHKKLPAVEAENAALRERLICEYCDADVNVPEAEPVQFGCCRKCLEKLQGERDAWQNECKTQRLLLDEARKAADEFRTERNALAAARQEQSDNLPNEHDIREP